MNLANRMLNNISRVNRIALPRMNCLYSTERRKDDVLPKNLNERLQTAHLQEENGLMHDKKPFKMHLEAGKEYSWCLCGWSKSQPMCDGFHKNVHYKIKLKPIKFKVEKTGNYWLCNCKQTKRRPFCDGTHKEKHIQDAVRS